MWFKRSKARMYRHRTVQILSAAAAAAGLFFQYRRWRAARR
jgi:hypothetical protein